MKPGDMHQMPDSGEPGERRRLIAAAAALDDRRNERN